MPQANWLPAALKYLKEYSFSLIPLKPDKKPTIEWKSYQTKRPTPWELTCWANKWPDSMLAVVTGKLWDTPRSAMEGTS